MDGSLKRRLVGATVLASLAVIFVPMLVDKRAESPPMKTLPQLPEPSPIQFDSRLLTDEIPAPTPLPIPVTKSREQSAKTEGQQKLAGPRQDKDLEARVGLSVWVVQVGSFSSLENAEKLVQKLRLAGLDTLDPERVDLGGKTIYRVRVGPEVDKDRAEGLLPKIRQVAQLDGRVQSYP